MSAVTREVPLPLERTGALLERNLESRSEWELGAVEREQGALEAHLRTGFGRAPAHMHFRLTSVEGRATAVSITVLRKSAWVSMSRCHRCALQLLDALMPGSD